ncbi:MAG: 3-phosphoshikimate 1-carboxyvinyltransferase [Gammaproteobacteria bacterium]|nr:3-phosphoshikimate 1-carboxyvinyltransferase [Gammaproteobacteria bacterium]
MSEAIDFHVEPSGKLAGRLRVAGDKSISHRAVMLGSLAAGETHITGLLEGEDVLATLGAFRAMGVRAEGPDKGNLVIFGAGLHDLKPPSNALNMGNSGTAMRLMAGVLAGQAFDSELIGDASLSQRPMNRVAEPLGRMGAVIQTAQGGRPPLRIKGGQRLRGIAYQIPVASAQVKSSLLLAGLYAEGETAVTEPAPTRDHTERMLRSFGYDVQTHGARISLRGGGRLKGCRINVPADISSATFFLVGASIAPGSDLVLEHVGINPARTGVLNILKLMGANLELLNSRELGGEPVADIRVRAAKLRGIRIPEDQVPLAIDEFPAIFIVAAAASGETVLTGAQELRVKESDRIAVMAQGLKQLGIYARETPDGIIIKGGQLQGGVIDSHGDHRIAMAFAMAGLIAAGPITVRDCKNVDTSFPGFARLAQRAGLSIEVQNGR